MKQLLFMSLIAFASCTSGVSTKEIPVDTTSALASVPTDVKQAAYTEEEKAGMKKELETLKKNFIKQDDEFNKVSWYTHKVFGKYWPARSTLRPEVRNDGMYYLESNYCAAKWILHEKVIVLADGKTIESPAVTVLSKNRKTDNDAYKVWEVNQYVEGDNGIMSFIVANKDKTIKVRFVSNEDVHDVTLSKADVKAITESVRLAELIKYFQ